jgi:uncharacterized protein YodC (DUF2158 family)
MHVEFKKGDIVRLKSGGPKMTVEDVVEDMGGDLSVYCTWFDEQRQHQKGGFAPGSLEPIRHHSAGISFA